MILFILWIILSLIFAGIASDKTIGFFGGLIVCLLLSPIIGLIIIVASGNKERPKRQYTCKHCQFSTTENSYYCPRCLQDSEGYTAEQNMERFKTREKTA